MKYVSLGLAFSVHWDFLKRLLGHCTCLMSFLLLSSVLPQGYVPGCNHPPVTGQLVISHLGYYLPNRGECFYFLGHLPGSV